MAVRLLTPDAAPELAIDANALSSLRAQARTAPAAAVSKAAGQFEALFVQMLMKQMREALPQDGPLSSDTTKSYTAMFDQQVAQQLGNRGIGLRKMIEQQLARQLGSANDAGGATKPQTSLKVDAKPSPQAGTVAASNTASTIASRPTPSLLPASVDAFIERMRPHAEAVAQAVGIPVQYLLAQAGLETGWGRSMPKGGSGGSSHNLFGIKAGAQWKGAVAEAATTEVVAGQAVKSVERFRAYGSFAEAFHDFAALLRDSARYAGVMTKLGDARAYADGLQRAGYATDPHYGAKLARSIELVSRKLGLDPAPVQVGTSAADKARTAG